MYRRQNKSKDDHLLELEIRIDNIKNQFILIQNMILELEKKVKRQQLNHSKSEELTQHQVDNIFNSSGSFERTNSEIIFKHVNGVLIDQITCTCEAEVDKEK